MKKSSLIILAIFGLLFVGCRNKQEKDTYLAPPAQEYSAADTAEIMNLVNQYVAYMNANDYDGMVSMLYVLHDSRVYPLDEHQRDSVKRGLQSIPMYKAKLNGITLRSNVNNEVSIKVQLIEDGDLEEDRGITKFYLNPIYINDEWYLTLLDTNAEGYRNVYQQQ